MRALIVLFALLLPAAALAEDAAVPPAGQVTISLAEYTALLTELGKSD